MAANFSPLIAAGVMVALIWGTKLLPRPTFNKFLRYPTGTGTLTSSPPRRRRTITTSVVSGPIGFAYPSMPDTSSSIGTLSDSEGSSDSEGLRWGYWPESTQNYQWRVQSLIRLCIGDDLGAPPPSPPLPLAPRLPSSPSQSYESLTPSG